MADGSPVSPNDLYGLYAKPAHDHVLGPGWAVVINLMGLDVREVIGGNEREASRAQRLVANHRDTLMDA